jgi:hypothetical protein
MKYFIASEAKQNEATKHCLMKAQVNIMCHFGYRREVGVGGMLVNYHNI